MDALKPEAVAMGRRAWVESKIGKGARSIVVIPKIGYTPSRKPQPLKHSV